MKREIKGSTLKKKKTEQRPQMKISHNQTVILNYQSCE